MENESMKVMEMRARCLFRSKKAKEKSDLLEVRKKGCKGVRWRAETHHSVVPRLTERTDTCESALVVDGSSTKLLQDLRRSCFGDGVGHSSERT